MKTFKNQAAERIIRECVRLSPAVGQLSDLAMQCDAVEAILSLNDAAWCSPRQDYAMLYDDGHGILKCAYLDRQAIMALAPDLGNLGNLKRLALPAESGLLRPSFVSQWRALESLEISGHSSESLNLSPLSALPNLRFLALHLQDVILDEFIELAPVLNGLSLDTALDMANIRHFKALTTLDCGTHCGGLEPLAALDKLKTLCIGTTDAESLHGLEGCAALERLFVCGNMLDDISALAELPALKSCTLTGNMLEDMTPLAGCALERLRISNSAATDFSPLQGLCDLSALWVDNTLFSDAALLSGMKDLRELNLGGTMVSDIKALTALNRLEVLHLDRCDNLEDVSPLYEMASLKKISLPEGMAARIMRDRAAPIDFAPKLI